MFFEEGTFITFIRPETLCENYFCIPKSPQGTFNFNIKPLENVTYLLCAFKFHLTL